MTESVVPSSYDSAVSRSGDPERFHQDAAAQDAIPRLAPRSSAHRGAACVGRALGRDVAGGFYVNRGVGLGRAGAILRRETKLLQYEGGPNAVDFE